MKTASVKIEGIVQGVGFRPFLLRLAREMGVRGRVVNASGTVVMFCQADAPTLDRLMERIRAERPAVSRIDRISVGETDLPPFSDFTIGASEPDDSDEILVPPDLPVCEQCLRELDDPENRRYRYPFISCTACGARYSIITAVPYDRERTTMDSYQLCPDCRAEYAQDERRCFAQTISCHDCGPQLIFRSPDGRETQREAAFAAAVEILRAGGILAMKSIGGYNYLCRTDLSDTVMRLRALKRREKKPFAVMFRDVAEIRKYCAVSAAEAAALRSDARPIVLLARTKGGIVPEIYSDSGDIGAFLPYTPLHYMLLKKFGSLVVTSANLSGSCILYRDAELPAHLPELLGGVLYNTREIVTPLDDSVVRQAAGGLQLLRRSRGMVPAPIDLPGGEYPPVAAFGGDLKSAFCLLQNGKAYLSQYFGDLQELSVYRAYADAYRHMKALFHLEPQAAVVDQHPGYLSREFGQKTGMPIIEVQHHAAHVYAVMAEHGLNQAIGVAFDGTGYGDDGTIWGGEFFTVDGAHYRRAGHLAQVTFCMGDRASSDGRLCALCYASAAGLQVAFDGYDTALVERALDNRIGTYASSSMGRLFDAVCALLGFKFENTYEGECAALLERHASLAAARGEPPYKLPFPIERRGGAYAADTARLFRAVTVGLRAGVNAERLALGFHEAVSRMTADICRRIREDSGLKAVCLGGGVFANRLLLERIVSLLGADGFSVFINRAVPSNDSGLALGQAYYACKYFAADDSVD